MTQKPTILIIDDNTSVIDTLKIIFSESYDILDYISTDKVIKNLRKMPKIHGMLIDYYLDDMSGLELIKHETFDYYKDVPKILVSAFYDDAQPTHVQADINKYFVTSISKPFDINHIKTLADKHFLSEEVVNVTVVN